MKGSKNSLWLRMSYMMVFWFCFGSTSVQSENKQPSFVTENPIVRLVLPEDQFDAAFYIDFLDDLRSSLRDPDEDPKNWHGYTVLRRTSINLPRAQRSQLVELSIENDEPVLTLALNSKTVSVAGFLARQRLHYFQDLSDIAFAAFPSVRTRHALPFDEGYCSLEDAADQRREEIPLGTRPLYDAIRNLYSAGHSGPIGHRQRQGAAKDLLIIIQMISEAARNSIIASRISLSIHNNEEQVPDPNMIRYENRWGRLSGRIQMAGPNGVFEPVELLNRQNERFYTSNVNDLYVRAAIALVLNSCSEDRKTYDHKFSPLIRSVVKNYEENICDVYEEPTVRIIGPNGLCADVKDGDYHNGNGIILWPCQSNPSINQLWTIKRNGMIQSNGKCLTPYGFSPGDYMMIYDCPSQVDDKTRWYIFDNGTLMSGTGLVLSANSVDHGTLLKVETNTYTTSQSWRPTSITQPFETSIIGIDRLCLQINEHGYVWLENCVRNKEDQRWVPYPDGSVRPRRDQQSCLFGDPNHVLVVACNTQSEGQRWEFKSDGSILNLNYNMVLDVKESNPSLKEIVLYPFYGQENQKWSLVF